MRPSFNDVILKRYHSEDPLANCRTITFQVTDDCCLKCSYCYQTHKGHNFMSKETAFQIIDLLFKMYDENKENTFINHHTKGLVLDFIGGEPFMNVSTISAAMEYFLNKCFETNHIWLTNFRASISTNGILFLEPEVQAFMDKYQNFVSLNITIDGPKEIHDACRVDYDGNGSFDRVMLAHENWIKRIHRKTELNTKVTIAPENLEHMDTIFDFFISKGYTQINANPIFEHKWTVDEAKRYFYILLRLADRLLSEEHIESNLFMDFIGQPIPSIQTSNWCGGTGAMLAFDPFGNAYPCLRYMPSSLGDSQPPIIIGNTQGIYNTPETHKIKEELDSITRQSQSTEECINCHIASGCAWCSGYNYQETGSCNKRSTNICWMHRARVLANVYYWNQYYRTHNIQRRLPLYLSRDIAKQIISDEEYDNLYFLSTWR